MTGRSAADPAAVVGAPRPRLRGQRCPRDSRQGAGATVERSSFQWFNAICPWLEKALALPRRPMLSSSKPAPQRVILNGVNAMVWTAPVFEEVSLCCEINSYASAKL